MLTWAIGSAATAPYNLSLIILSIKWISCHKDDLLHVYPPATKESIATMILLGFLETRG
jgi:hypothetical protein